jgi:hypothetical protein
MPVDFDIPDIPDMWTIDDGAYRKYKKLKITSAWRLDRIYHCEVEHGEYLWAEAYASKVVLSKAETYYEMGDKSDVVAMYHGRTPSFKEISSHMGWEVDDEGVWDD